MSVDAAQAWVLVGVPGLVAAAALFAGHSRIRAWVGYVLLAGLVALFVVVDGGAVSAAIIGLVVVGLVATGRGSSLVDDAYEEHELRDRLTDAV